jgi:hypothetical protein
MQFEIERDDQCTGVHCSTALEGIAVSGMARHVGTGASRLQKAQSLRIRRASRRQSVHERAVHAHQAHTGATEQPQHR